MSFSSENGYIPLSIEALMDQVRTGVNAQFGTTYTAENFVGSNFYKFYYALIQRLQENEVKTSEIFLKLQDYFKFTNERILRPVVTPQGLIEAMNAAGYVASVKPANDTDAGKVFVCVDLDDAADDYAVDKLAVCTLIKNSTAAGIVSQGDEVESIVLSNGQSFDFKFDLPTRIETLLRLTLNLSDNNQSVIKGPDAIKQDLLTNINSSYSLGKDFEPQRYYSTVDAPWAASILLEYSIDDGETWLSTVYESDYDDLLEFSLANTTLVES